MTHTSHQTAVPVGAAAVMVLPDPGGPTRSNLRRADRAWARSRVFSHQGDDSGTVARRAGGQARKARKYRCIRFRKNPRWQELFPHLQEVGVEVAVDSDLAALRAAYQDHLRR